MRQPIRRIPGMLLGVVASVCLAPPAAAGEHPTAMPRIRTTDARVVRVLASAVERSPTLRGLVEVIDASDVIIHMTTFGPDADRPHGGELQLAASAEGVRYLRMALRRDLSDPQLAVLLAHELQHAVEVASRPQVACQDSMRALYDAIGYPVRGHRWETREAIEVADQVRHELYGRLVPHGPR
jgi:hypothetical protein